MIYFSWRTREVAVASFETRSVVKKILLDVTPVLDEKQRRILYGSAAEALGHGGVAFVNEVTGCKSQ